MKNASIKLDIRMFDEQYNSYYDEAEITIPLDFLREYGMEQIIEMLASHVFESVVEQYENKNIENKENEDE